MAIDLSPFHSRSRHGRRKLRGVSALLLSASLLLLCACSPAGDTDGNVAAIAAAFAAGTSDLQVQGQGEVVRVLRDDDQGSRHQRFILRLANGQTLLVAHNIDLAPRLPGLRRGDSVEFAGEYEWNAQGGVLHWTHHDPAGRHADGYLKWRGDVYR